MEPSLRSGHGFLVEHLIRISLKKRVSGVFGCASAMPYYQTWKEYSGAAEELCRIDHLKVRVPLKRQHCVKVTEAEVRRLKYKTDYIHDVKKIEKLHWKLMRLMSSESCSISVVAE